MVDDCGNAAVDQIQVITVEDNIAPTFTAPLALTIYKDAACAYDASVAITGDVTNEADNCDNSTNATYTDAVANGTCTGEQIITRTWSLVDDCGNAAIDQIQIITVEDNLAPNTVCKNIIINLDANGLAAILPTDIDSGSTDNCTATTNLTLSASPLNFDCSNVGDNIVVMTVTDDCGNTSSCNATVTIHDITPAVLTCPIDQDLFIDANCDISLPDYTPLLTATDACGIATITQLPAPGTVFNGGDAGAHSVEFTVIDINGNTSNCSFNVNIIDDEAFTIDIVNDVDVQCFGAADGTITVITTGGLSGLLYSIDGIDYSNTTGLFTNLSPSIYTVSVRNINNCEAIWATDIIITEPPLLEIDDVTKLDVLVCYGDLTGEIDINAIGGTPSYEYSIDNGIVWQSSSHFGGLAAGTYDVVLRDAHNCISYWGSTIEIDQPASLNLLDIDIVDITSCYGDLSGEIHIAAVGGTGIHSYSIDQGDTWFENDGHFVGLAGGFYHIQIHDENACEYVLDNPVQINQPAQLIVNDVSVIDVSTCYGNTNGSLDISANGGTGNISYSIDGGNTFVNNSGLFENLAAGTYEVFISDEHNCIGEYASNPITITEPIQVIMTTTTTDVAACAGDASGIISIIASGGTGIYSYSIDGGNSWNSNYEFHNLIAGSYVVMTKDDLGCEQFYAGNPVIINEPEVIVFNDVQTVDAGCYGDGLGEITISASGGTGSLQYSIDGGAHYQFSESFVDVAAGEYELIIKDENECEISYTNNPLYITQSSEILIPEVLAENGGCQGGLGSITITANGGEGTLYYSIDNGNSYQSSAAFGNLPADTYIVIVKDANSCTQYYSGNPVVIVEQYPSEVFINVNPHQGPYCLNEIVTLEAYAFRAISYSWEPGQQNNSTIEVTSDTPGIVSYTVTVINELGCESQASIDIEYDECMAVEEFDLEEDVSINLYPNPNNGEFNLELAGIKDEVKISIIDFAGRLIMEERIMDITSDKLEKHYNLNNYERGVYFLKITYGESISYKKVVIQ